MKNLKVVQQSDIFLDLSNICHVSTEEWTNCFVVSSESAVAVISETTVSTFSTSAEYGAILRCHPLGHPQVCITTKKAVLVWRFTDDTVLEKFEPPSNVECVAFSPDKLTVVFITADHRVTVLTSSLVPIGTTDLEQAGFGTAAPIALGWGKKETQFHGSLGKQAALAKTDENTCVVSEHDDGRFEACWRDDGKYFVISYADSGLQNCRRLRVYTESGELYSTSQTISFAEPGLCWRPRIQLITAIQRRPGRGLDVIFFETNAERHGEFDLLDATLEHSFRVGQIDFDEQGNVLAVLCVPVQPGLHSAFIRLITCSNYHWFTKREIRFDGIISPGGPNVIHSHLAFVWGSPTSPNGLYNLHVAASVPSNSDCPQALENPTKTVIRSWSFCPTYDRDCGSVEQPCNGRIDAPILASGFVCVVDKNAIQLTALARCILPPPMCSTRLTIRSSSSMGENPPFSVVSASFPGLWISSPKDPTVCSLLLQFEYSSSQLSPTGLVLVELMLGISSQRHQTFTDEEIMVDAQWIAGARSVVPWPRTVRVIHIPDTIFSADAYDGPVRLALNVANRFHTCGGKELAHITWICPTRVAFVSCNGRLVGLMNLECTSSAAVRWLLCVDSTSSSSVRICGLCLSPDGYFCVQLTSGDVFVYILQDLLSSEHCILIPKLEQTCPESELSSTVCSPPIHYIIKLPVACDHLTVVRFTESTKQRTVSRFPPATSSFLTYRCFLLALHESSHRLYGAYIPTSNELVQTPTRSKAATLVMDMCSSFIALPNFLLSTSMRKLLICVPTQFDAVTFASSESCLMELISRLTIPSELQHIGQGASKNWYNDYLHPIENGAVLVTAVPNDTGVVLQMPRGNLEQVHPRALVLTHLADLLNNAKYSEALLLMRRHRVNMNLLYDHNPETFKRNVKMLLQNVENPDLLTLFISDLLEEDVSETMYGTFYKSPTAQFYRDVDTKHAVSSSRFKSLRTGYKLNNVCDLLLIHMGNEKRFLLPTLTCYAKKKPSELHSALLLLKTFNEAGESDLWEIGVRHLQYFATPNELYRVALGTYDLDLAQLMAQRTQLDPKEYLADLNELRSITSAETDACGDVQLTCKQAYQRYKIDNQLMRFSSALKHLKAAGPEHSNELISYTDEHKLYGCALELFNDTDPEFKVISRSWANHLLTVQKLACAGQVYLRAGLYALAARAFLSAVQPQLWSIAVSLARQLHGNDEQRDDGVALSEREVCEQALKIAVRLKDLNRHQEAITVYLDILKDPDSAIVTALDGGLWSDARRLAATFIKPETLKKWLRPKLIEACSVLQERIENTSTEFAELFDRLIVLRRRHMDEAESRRIAQLHGDGECALDSATESDIFSDTSSLSDTSLSESVGGLSLRSGGTRTSGRSAKNRRKQEARKWSSKPGSKYEEVGLLKALYQSVELSQRLATEVTTIATELWNASMPNEGRTLLRCINHLLADQKSAIPVIWDEWITEKDSQFHPYQRDEGRKRYPFKEPFIIFAPTMNKTLVECAILDINS